MQYKQKIVWIGLVLLGFTITSCSYHFGTVAGGSAVVTSGAYTSIDYAFGTAQTTHLLGIGGNKKDALVLEAKRNLQDNYPLGSGQLLGQTTVDFKHTLIGPVLMTKVIVSAEVIDFSSTERDEASIAANRNAFTNSPTQHIIYNGQEVGYKYQGDTLRARVLGREGSRYIIQYYNPENKLKIKRTLITNLIYDQGVHAVSQGKDDLGKAEFERVIFRYNGMDISGELVREDDNSALIRIEQANGKKVGVYVQSGDIKVRYPKEGD